MKKITNSRKGMVSEKEFLGEILAVYIVAGIQVNNVCDEQRRPGLNFTANIIDSGRLYRKMTIARAAEGDLKKMAKASYYAERLESLRVVMLESRDSHLAEYKSAKDGIIKKQIKLKAKLKAKHGMTIADNAPASLTSTRGKSLTLPYDDMIAELDRGISMLS